MALCRLTTVQFQDAISRYIDTSKPDELIKKQLKQLKLSWEQQQVSTDVVDNKPHNQWKLDGTLTISSEYISIAIHAKCSCKVKNVKDTKEEVVNTVDTPFDEFYFQLKVTGTLLTEVKEVDGEEKLSSKERRAKSKLHAGIIKRLQADKLIRNLLEGDEGSVLCEAVIQQTTNCANQLEERVNVNEDVLSGIKNAIFSHVEDNLDVFELLLNMPYLPRSSGRDGLDSAVPSDLTTQGLESGTSKVHDMLGDRAYLRLLEDAMFDACEKEGEDEILDDLNLSCGNAIESGDCDANEGKRRRK